ncbi:MAG: methanethiol S-methyltransferase [Bacteroidota bacterium]
MKKSLFILYAVLCYGIFFVTFLYAIGFMGNLFVPKSLDSGVGALSFNAIVVNLALLTVFALQHSVMARPKFKAWLTQFVPQPIERSTYVLFTSLALILLFWQWQPMTEVIWSVEHPLGAMVLQGLYVFGFLIVLLSTFMINHFDLFGLKQVYDHWKGHTPLATKFTTRYLYAFVRHPITLGFLISLWATPIMTIGHLLFSVATTTYIIIAVKYFEERDLRNSLGQAYEAYQKKVPMLIPLPGRKA